MARMEGEIGMERLQDCTAVVTGAGTGLGRAIALRFGAEGAAVVVNDLDPKSAADTGRTVEEAGGRAQVVPGDVTDRRITDALAGEAKRRFGGLEIWVNNAGGAQPRAMESIDDERYREDRALNLDAVWYGMQSALAIMGPQGRGALLTISSGAALGAVPGLSAYGAAKAGVIALTRSVAVEYGPRGVRANVLCPGPIETPSLRSWLETLPGGPEAYGRQVPLGRLGHPDDVASAAVFLVSEEAAFVSGATLVVDGGVSSALASPRAD